MRTDVSGRRSVFRLGVWCLLLSAYCLPGCSVPNLEPDDCRQSRDTVKQFYSWYIGTGPDAASKAPELFDPYISPSFDRSAGTDPFVLTNDFPKAFRVGECKTLEPDKRTQFEVLLFWKDDVRSEQQPIRVVTEKTNGRWLIRSIGR